VLFENPASRSTKKEANSVGDPPDGQPFTTKILHQAQTNTEVVNIPFRE